MVIDTTDDERCGICGKPATTWDDDLYAAFCDDCYVNTLMMMHMAGIGTVSEVN